MRPPGAASSSAKSIQEDEIPLAVMAGRMKKSNNNNNNNTLIYIAPACRMTSEALADSSSRATECLTEK